MSYFYRSKNISGVSINEDSLISLSTAIVECCVKMNEQAQKESREVCAQCVFFILFDGKGYKVDSIGELVKYFRQATRIDQIIFTIETYQSRQSNRMNGSWMELRIDERNSNSSTMIVASEDNEWVDSLWITIQDLLNKCKNKFRFFRTAWTMLSIQISGVTVGFLLSLWTASKLAPKLSIDGAFALSFICIFILFSNLWSFAIPLIIKLIDFLFPSVKFVINGKNYFHWSVQAIIGAIASAVILYFISSMLLFALEMLNSIIKK
ncbi:membrane domain protein [Escherichia coli]|nr:membrane domain protein [Escherichia coli]EKP6539873.1 membrane domain protein [Escherichia coli]WGB41664.1 membrane domain protein [Escherichia coli]